MRMDSPGGRPCRIIVAGQELHPARFLEFVLSEAGYQTAVARDVREVHDLMRDFPPDAILFDSSLYRPFERSVLGRPLSTAGGSSPTVVVLGPRDDPGVRQHALDSGASYYCAKPVQPSVLLEQLRGLDLPPILGEEAAS